MRALAAAFVAVFTLPAAAQEAVDAVEANEAEAGDTGFGGERNEIETTPERSESGTPQASTSPAPESYVVQPGDTLWNLSQRFLNNPWYWPKIWSYNPDFDNPNWIRPGSQVRFYSGGTPMAAETRDDEGSDEAEPDFEDIQVGGFEGADVADRFNPTGEEHRRRDFFVPSERIDESGQVLNSPEEKLLLSVTDRVYLRLRKQVQPGEVVQVYRPAREIKHPVTGASLGKLVSLVGEIRVDALSREQALGTIINSWDTIERGDFVGVLPVGGQPIQAVANTKNVKGYIVDTGPLSLTFFGESFVVVVDKGSADGVQAGNHFTVVRAGDPYLRQYSGLADEDVGDILIIETEKNVSTGILMNSSREIVAGDRCEMRLTE
jgi:hypothetical protein